jgi:dUTP pyrophosphatase
MMSDDKDTNKLFVQRLHSAARLPWRGSDEAAGYDVCSIEDVRIDVGAYVRVRTGLAIRVPESTYGRIAPRSGLAAKHGIDVLAGVVDRDYTGEVVVILINHGQVPFDVHAGDRIAQLVLERVCIANDVVDVSELASSRRGDGGFGSTGV